MSERMKNEKCEENKTKTKSRLQMLENDQINDRLVLNVKMKGSQIVPAVIH